MTTDINRQTVFANRFISSEFEGDQFLLFVGDDVRGKEYCIGFKKEIMTEVIRGLKGLEPEAVST